MRSSRLRLSHGFALTAALLVLLLLSALATAMILVVNSETRIHTVDSQNTQAYYAAEAGMEKMMVDLYELYQTQQSPTVSQIQALGNSSYWPSLPGITYAEYTFTVPNGRTATQTWHRLAIAAGFHALVEQAGLSRKHPRIPCG